MYIADATAQLFMLSQFIQLHFQALLNYLFRSCICVSLLCIYFSLFCLYSRLKALLTCFFLMFLGCGLVCCCAYCVTVFGKRCCLQWWPCGPKFCILTSTVKRVLSDSNYNIISSHALQTVAGE